MVLDFENIDLVAILSFIISEKLDMRKISMSVFGISFAF
jgi:hypothetical protein